MIPAVWEWLPRFAEEENRLQHSSFKVTEEAATDQDSARKLLLFYDLEKAPHPTLGLKSLSPGPGVLKSLGKT